MITSRDNVCPRMVGWEECRNFFFLVTRTCTESLKWKSERLPISCWTIKWKRDTSKAWLLKDHSHREQFDQRSVSICHVMLSFRVASWSIKMDVGTVLTVWSTWCSLAIQDSICTHHCRTRPTVMIIHRKRPLRPNLETDLCSPIYSSYVVL